MSEQPADKPDDDTDAAHPFVHPENPADFQAARKAYDDEMSERITERLKRIPYSKRGRWRPADGS
jgi:hypothetical protein